MMNRAFQQTRRFGAVAMVMGLTLVTACTPIVRNYGYVPAEDQLAEVAVGKDTRDSVAEKIGLPLNRGFEADGDWYYVASTRETYGPVEPKTTVREVVAIRFDDAGTVRNVEHYGLDDGQEIVLTARVTETAVADQNLIRQIFGNLGGPSASDFLE